MVAHTDAENKEAKRNKTKFTAKKLEILDDFTAISKPQQRYENKAQKLHYLLIFSELLVPDANALCLSFELECIFRQFFVPLLHQALHVHRTV